MDKPFDLHLIRQANIGISVFGRLKILDSSAPLFCTLENLNYIIPAGTYEYYFAFSPKFKKVLPYLVVPHRQGIMFHVGNFATDSRGCILLGFDFSCRNGGFMLTQSRDAVAKFMDYVYLPLSGFSKLRGQIIIENVDELPF